VDAFARSYEAERQRLAKTVHDAVTHMSERTSSAQTISKRLQEESAEVKRLALRLQVG
jgi:predicted outer membrane protein